MSNKWPGAGASQEVAAKVKAILSTESVSPPEASQPSLPAKAPTVQQPARRNVLPVIGGIIAVLIATSMLLFFWRWRTTAPPAPVQSAPISGTVESSSVSPVSVVPTEAGSTPEAVPKTATSTSAKHAMILGILRAIETHDSRAFLAYTVDKQTDYLGHKMHPMPSSNKIWSKTPDLINGSGLFPIYPLLRRHLGVTQLNIIRMHSMFEVKNIRHDVVLTFITCLRLHPDCRACL